MKTDSQRLLRAIRAAQRGDTIAAIRLLRALVRRAPHVPTLQLMLADQLHRQELFDQAATGYRKGLELLERGVTAVWPPDVPLGAPPSPAAIRTALASALEGAGDEEGAEREYRRAVEVGGEPDSWVALGHHLENRGRRREARRCYLEALRQDRRHADALSALGHLHVWEAPGRAARCLRRALEVQPRHGEALSGLAYALLALGRYDEAETILDRAVRFDDGARPHVYLGHVHEARGEHAKARAAYQRGQRRAPGDPHPLFALGDNHRRHGDAAEAHRAYSAALVISPNCPDALLRLGLLFHERLDDPRQAAVCIERGLEIAPFHPWRSWLEEEILPALAHSANPGPP